MKKKTKVIKRKYFKEDDFYLLPKNIYGDMYLVYLANRIKEDDPDLYDMLLKDGKEAMHDFLEDGHEEKYESPKSVLAAKIDDISVEECEDILKLIKFREMNSGR